MYRMLQAGARHGTPVVLYIRETGEEEEEEEPSPTTFVILYFVFYFNVFRLL